MQGSKNNNTKGVFYANKGVVKTASILFIVASALYIVASALNIVGIVTHDIWTRETVQSLVFSCIALAFVFALTAVAILVIIKKRKLYMALALSFLIIIGILSLIALESLPRWSHHRHRLFSELEGFSITAIMLSIVAGILSIISISVRKPTANAQNATTYNQGVTNMQPSPVPQEKQKPEVTLFKRIASTLAIVGSALVFLSLFVNVASCTGCNDEYFNNFFGITFFIRIGLSVAAIAMAGMMLNKFERRIALLILSALVLMLESLFLLLAQFYFAPLRPSDAFGTIVVVSIIAIVLNAGSVVLNIVSLFTEKNVVYNKHVNHFTNQNQYTPEKNNRQPPQPQQQWQPPPPQYNTKEPAQQPLMQPQDKPTWPPPPKTFSEYQQEKASASKSVLNSQKADSYNSNAEKYDDFYKDIKNKYNKSQKPEEEILPDFDWYDE